MKKTTSIILVIFICISVIIFILNSCNNKHEVYDVDTELGDHLSIEVYLSGNIDGLYLTYKIYNKDYEGLALFNLTDRFRTELPSNPLATFEVIGSYGNTHFYKLHNEVIYVYNDMRIGRLPSYYNLNEYKSEYSYMGIEYMEIRKAVISDLIKTGNFDYIYQFGVILAYERNDDIKLLLQRYADGNFSEEELSANENSIKTTDEMISWAKDLLNEYYS